jgi:hypothetical protein
VTRSRFFAPLVLFALTVGVFWKLVLTKQYTWLDSPDNAFQVAPWLQAQAAAFHRGEWLLWDPLLIGGQSLIGQMQPGAAAPLNWLLFAWPMHHGFLSTGTLNWYFVLIHYFAALTAYLLCRDLGRSRTASVLAASAYAFAGWVGTTNWPQMLQSAVWAPLAVMFSLRAIRGERAVANSLLSGFFLGVEWLTGHHQIPLFTTLAIAGIWIYHAARAKVARIRVERSVLFAALIVVMIAAGALQTLPAYSYGKTALRWVGASHALRFDETVPYSVHDEYSLQPWSVLGIIINGISSFSNPFVGVVVLFLAISGVVLERDQLPVRIFAAVSLCALLFGFASYSIFGGILYAIMPMLDKARSPAMAAFIFDLGICPLAAFGLDALPNALQSDWIRRATIAIGGIAAFLWIFIFASEATKLPVTARLSHVSMAAFAATLLLWLLWAMRSGAAQSPVWFLALVMIEIGWVADVDRINFDAGWKSWGQVSRDHDIAQILKSRPVFFRVEVNDQDVPYNFGDWYGVETYLGYVASLPESFTRMLGEQRTRQLLGVQYYIGKTASRPDQREIFTDAAGIKLFEMPGALPRVRAVHEVTAIVHADRVGETLNAIDITRAAFLLNETPPALENCSGDQVNILRAAAQSIDIDASMACRGMVILGNQMSSDWVAIVDGKRAQIYAAYSILTGIIADAGHHRIELRYRPVSVYVGGALTALAALIALAAIRMHR